jgi:hypothetical protein
MEPYHLRLGWVVTPADLVTLMFVKPGLAPHAGKTYIPELTHFAGTPTRSSHAVKSITKVIFMRIDQANDRVAEFRCHSAADPVKFRCRPLSQIRAKLLIYRRFSP